jgi:hypothetical protein
MKLTLLLVVLLLNGCVINLAGIPKKAPSTLGKVSKEIMVEYDRFKDITWIKTPLYLSRHDSIGTFSIEVMFRALYKPSDTRQYLQLYVFSQSADWSFYDSAYGEDGYEFEFIRIGNDVGENIGRVSTNEQFTLMVPIEKLEKIAQKDYEIKVYGSRNEIIIKVPKQLTKAFLDNVNCYESKDC